ncbi:MAG: serine hydrolase domain-containing protein, partial [Candidatus Acidiferrales bacterium]
MRDNRSAALPVFCFIALFAIEICLAAPASRARQAQKPSPRTLPSANAPALSVLDSILQSAVDHDEVPGAVLVVSHRGNVIYDKAFGQRSLIPSREPMTIDTVFDLASLTKAVATAPAVMKLVEEGKLRLDDPVAHYLPAFSSNGKDQITVRMLLTHSGGLAPDPPIEATLAGKAALIDEINSETLIAPPGMRFIYSDTGFIVLGELVEKMSGTPLDEFAQREIFEPLRMSHTRFLPPTDWTPKIAPTEEIDLPEGAKPGSGRGTVLRGVVHDPTSRAIGGVAGHAGLFSTAADLAIFCEMVM